MDPSRARELLTELLAEIDRSARTLSEEHAQDPGELSSFDQHPADTATNISDTDRSDAAVAVLAGQRDQVVAALRRLDAGTYGMCVDCGQPLPDERLQARPEAARCVSCQAKSEGRVWPARSS